MPCSCKHYGNLTILQSADSREAQRSSSYVVYMLLNHSLIFCGFTTILRESVYSFVEVIYVL